MSKQQNFFIDHGEVFVTDIAVTDEDGPVDLTGHVFKFNTAETAVDGTVEGNTVTFSVPNLEEDTRYVIDHTYPDSTYEWVLYGDVKVREWL